MEKEEEEDARPAIIDTYLSPHKSVVSDPLLARSKEE
jgi:hypothetical protein